MRAILFVLFIHVGIFASSQERCATTNYTETQKTSTFSQSIQKAEIFVQQRTSLAATQTGVDVTVIKIPVVVHVLYNNADQNISDAQIKSQITALNNDFRRKSADTINTPSRFKYLAADAHIEFYLATADAKGRATTGIVRKQTSISLWMANDRVKASVQGGDDAWDANSYLNIWVCNLASGLGYSSVPGSDGSKDGLVINYTVFGMMNTSAPHSLGRIAVHEVGHWLGLRHIWGDVSCGDDGIGDTPQQGWATQGCPNGFRSTCSNGEVGDMYMNFMDYTNDACMNLFTEGQKSKMRTVFANGGPRASLLISKGLSEPRVEESLIMDENVKSAVYPNPATAEIMINAGKIGSGKNVTIINSNGVILFTVTINTPAQKISVSSLKPGLYFIKGEGLMERFIKL